VALQEAIQPGADLVQPAVQICGADQRLEGIGQVGALGASAGGLFALAQQEMRAQTDLVRKARQPRGAHNVRAHGGQFTLVHGRVATEQPLAH